MDPLLAVCLILAAFLGGMLWGYRVAKVGIIEILKLTEKKQDTDNADWWKTTGEDQ